MSPLVTLLVVSLVPPWRDPRIHAMGNHGWGGLAHAVLAWPAVRLIDTLAYGGEDVRAILRAQAGAVDLGCGIGVSTPPGGIGVDASVEMLRVASALHPTTRFERGLAEVWGEEGAAPCAILAFILHEQPRCRRVRILRNALRVCQHNVIVMDIHPAYTPLPSMLLGEPYLPEYLEHIEEDVRDVARERGARVLRVDMHSDRLVMWNITKW